MYHYSIPIGSLTMSKILASGKTSARKCFTITKFWPSSTFVSKDKKDLLKVVFLNEREKKEISEKKILPGQDCVGATSIPDAS